MYIPSLNLTYSDVLRMLNIPNVRSKPVRSSNGEMNALILLGCLKVYLKISAGWCTHTIALTGKTALIAGASKHPGYEIAEDLAGRGCRIILADVGGLEAIRGKLIKKTGNKRIENKYVDFMRLDTVRQLVRDIIKEETQLNLLIFTDHVTGLDHKPTEDGFFKVVQYNHLAPFLLTYELMALLKSTPGSRVIFRSNVLAFLHKVYSPADISDLPTNRSHLLHDIFEYANSNVLTIMTMSCFAEMLRDNRVYCCAVHPGFMHMKIIDLYRDMGLKKTDFLPSLLLGKLFPMFFQFFGKTYVEGAQTSIHAAVSPDVRDIRGKFLSDCRMIMQPPAAQMRMFRLKIFEETKRLVAAGESYSKPASPIEPRSELPGDKIKLTTPPSSRSSPIGQPKKNAAGKPLPSKEQK